MPGCLSALIVLLQIVLKALIVTHVLMREGDQQIFHELSFNIDRLRYTCICPSGPT